MKKLLLLLLVSTLLFCTTSAQTKEVATLEPKSEIPKETVIIKNAAANYKIGDVFISHSIPDSIKQSKNYRVEWIAANIETGGIQHMGWCEPITTCYLASYIYWNGQVLILTMIVATGCNNTVSNYSGVCEFVSLTAPTQEQIESKMKDYITINAPDHDLHIKQKTESVINK